MNEALFPRRDGHRHGGFTLIEVVIALAIFLFGALAIVRIFPPALGVIQNSGDRLTAVNMNRTTLARYAKESSALPYAIYNNTFNSTTDTFVPVAFAGSTVGSAIRNNAIPRSNVQTITDSSLDRFKLVSGEKQKVRSVSGVTFVVTSFPIAGPDTTTRTPLARVYREVTMSGVTTQTKIIGIGNRTGFLDFSNASPAPPPANDNLIYYVSYKYLENGVLNATNDEAVRSFVGGVARVTATPPVLGVVNTTDVQVLQGRRTTPGPTVVVVDGPIQARYRAPLALATPANNVIQNTRNNLGILFLDSAALTAAGVSVGDEVSVDYQINTWSQLVHNSLPSVTPEATPTPGPNPSPVTPPTPREVVLPLRLLADEGDNASIYSLLSYFNAAGAASLEANAMNADDTLRTPGQFTLMGVNRKAGRVMFDIQDYTVTQSRIVYQTLDNWTHQLSVAPAHYTPYYSALINNPSGGTTQAEPWRYYYWSSDSANQPGRIFFPPSEAGKTISLSYSYAGSTVPVSGAVVTINERWIRATEAPLAARDLAVMDNGEQWLAYAEPKLTTGGTPINLTSISAVKGVSVQARTAWLDGDKFNQVSTVGFRGDSN